jgi:tRNA(Ile)-lysidine synthetase-like protein
MYHVAVHSLALRVLSHIRRQELLKAGDCVGVAVSGGIDSVALLRLMLELRSELGVVLSVVHFNHNLRGAESGADEEFVANLARENDLRFCFDSDDVSRIASEEHVSVETAARDVRYGFFESLLSEGQTKSPLLANSATSGAPKEVENPTLSQIMRHEWSNPGLNKIATGHTLDDQAETVLMRMIRGAGTGGLGAIYPRIAVEDDDGEVCGEIIRPLLSIRRRDLRQYLFDIRQDWREDSTNTDQAFTRNRVRQLVLPLLEKEFNPAVAENLAELAEIARGEEDYWDNEVAGWMGTGVHWSEPEWAQSSANLVQIKGAGDRCTPNARHDGQDDKEGRLAPIATHNPPIRRASLAQGRPSGAMAPSDPLTGEDRSSQDDNALRLRERIDAAPWLVMNASIDRLWFLGEPLAVQRRVVKAIGDHAGFPLEFKHVEEILHFIADDHRSGKELSLPLGWKVARTPNEIVFLTPDLRDAELARDYEYETPIPGQVRIYEAGSTVEVWRITAEAAQGYNPEELLDAESLSGRLRVRNWRPGDRFWPAHTKSPKKIKELLQERHVPQAERRRWPVVVSGDEIVWLRGFPLPAKLRAHPGRDAILITEKPLAESAT